MYDFKKVAYPLKGSTPIKARPTGIESLQSMVMRESDRGSAAGAIERVNFSSGLAIKSCFSSVSRTRPSGIDAFSFSVSAKSMKK